MPQFIQGDPIRILTMLACVGLIGLAWDGLKRRRGYPAPYVFSASWAAHTLLFYALYYLTNRWDFDPSIRLMIGYWPPVIWAQAALSTLILQAARVYHQRRNE